MFFKTGRKIGTGKKECEDVQIIFIDRYLIRLTEIVLKLTFTFTNLELSDYGKNSSQLLNYHLADQIIDYWLLQT